MDNNNLQINDNRTKFKIKKKLNSVNVSKILKQMITFIEHCVNQNVVVNIVIVFK